MSQPRVLILRAPGTNCDVETAFAFQTAGALADVVHINRVLEKPQQLNDAQILCIPGGFSYGDDVAAGRILGNQIRHHLFQCIHDFRAAGKLILGICNGFQVLIKSGVLLDDPLDTADSSAGGLNGEASATLTWNDSGKFEDRWVNLKVQKNTTPLLNGIESMYLPVAHAEGKFVASDEATLRRLEASGQLLLRYTDPTASNGDHVSYPLNPNGSQLDVAGVSDSTGRVLGLMPHPERHIDRTQHPRWTRGEGDPVGDGLKMFQNAVAYFR
jgi:phosphoribosylformylglycinamidine synthase I